MDSAEEGEVSALQAHKSCPVVLRHEGALEILAFAHPLAGLQLVKGSIEPGESAAAAALRELAEEAGIASAWVERNLGCWHSGHQGQVWSFHGCVVPHALPDAWVHHAADDGGHDFRFFWHPLESTADAASWHPAFRGALDFIRNAMGPPLRG